MIALAHTATGAHNQNGRVERMHRTLMNDVRTKLAESQLPSAHWVDALLHSVYTRNRVPNRDGKVPLHLFMGLTGKNIDYGAMHTFGQPCITRDHSPNPSKLDPRGQDRRIIGRASTGGTYLVLGQDNQVRASRDVTPVHHKAHAETRPTTVDLDNDDLEDNEPDAATPRKPAVDMPDDKEARNV